MQCATMRCSVLQCAAVCCSVLQCVAMCCSELQVCCKCVAVCRSEYQRSGRPAAVCAPTVCFPQDVTFWNPRICLNHIYTCLRCLNAIFSKRENMPKRTWNGGAKECARIDLFEWSRDLQKKPVYLQRDLDLSNRKKETYTVCVKWMTCV